MDQHVKVVGAFYIIFGGIGLLTALVLVLVFGGAAGLVSLIAADNPDALVALPIIGAVGSLVLTLTLLMAVPRILVGFGLLQYRPWARIGGLVLAVIGLINIPFGTVLGVYTLWTLLSRDGARLFETTPIGSPPPPATPPAAPPAG